MTVPPNHFFIPECNQLKENFDRFCEKSSILYSDQNGWTAIIQPLNIFFSYTSNPYKSREEAWLKTQLMLAVPFLSTLCTNNSNLIVVTNKEEIVCASRDFMKVYGDLGGLEFRVYAEKLFPVLKIHKTYLQECDNVSFFIRASELIDARIYEMEIGKLSYQVIQAIYPHNELDFTDTAI